MVDRWDSLPRWFRNASLSSALILSIAVVLAAWIVALNIANRPVHVSDVQSQAAEAQALFAAGGLTFTAVLVWFTGFYAVQTSRQVRRIEVDAADRLALVRSEQARPVGGFIRVRQSVYEQSENAHRYIELVVVNASALPVRALRGVVVDDSSGETAIEFGTAPWVLPCSEEQVLGEPVQVPARLIGDLRLELVYEDDAGATWRKYRAGLELLEAR